MDSPLTDHYSTPGYTGSSLVGPLSVSIQCYGYDQFECGCASTKVPLLGRTGLRQCPLKVGNTSLTDPEACEVPPDLHVDRVSQLSFANTSGVGTLRVKRGVHRLPPRSSGVMIAINDTGTAVVTADTIDWLRMEAAGAGRLVLGGTGWWAWDSTYLLYAPEWTTQRGLVRELDRLSKPFSMTVVGGVGLSQLSQVLIAVPNSNVTWYTAAWDGGVIGGRGTVLITEQVSDFIDS